MTETTTCPNCGRPVSENVLIRLSTGRRAQCFCPKCYNYGLSQAEARHQEQQSKYHAKAEAGRGRRRFASK